MLSLVAPPVCWSCGAGAPPHQPLCLSCHASLHWLGPEPVTLVAPVPSAVARRAAVELAVSVWAPLAYEGPARALVRGLKYQGAAGLADPLSAQIVANARAGLLDPRATLVPVPLHPARRRRRGYNQAERLAVALARRSGLEVSDCLSRTGVATHQVGRGRVERLEGLAGGIELRIGADAPRAAVLVDDVVTTGATLAACAAALRAAGTGGIEAVAYARTPGR